MKKLYFVLALCCNLFLISGFSQSGFIIKGKLIDKTSKNAIEYGTLAIYSAKDSSITTGGVTDFAGNFSLNIKTPGTYYLHASFIGFETKKIGNIVLNSKQKVFDAKIISLSVNSIHVKDVVVVGEKTSVKYQMDKKIIAVGKDIASSNGSAIDVLETAPSINVDIDGNVKMRGNSNFQVLINGMPSTLSGREALQQIPANNIKNIELITNPSAKYDAGNTAGIINIILKEEKKIGTSGMVRLKVGTFENYSAGVNLNHNINKFAISFSASLYNNNRPMESNDSLRTTFKDTVVTLKETKSAWNFKGFSFNYGVDYQISKTQNLSFNYIMGRWGMYVYSKEKVFQTNQSLNTTNDNISENDQARFSNFYGPSLNYNGNFKNKSKLSIYLGYSLRDFKEKIFNSQFDINESLQVKEKSTELGFRQQMTTRLDYTLPIKTGKLELGGKIAAAWNDEKNNNYILDLNKNTYSFQSFNNEDIYYTQKIYGLYSNYSNKYKKLDFALGLRAEYIDRVIDFTTENTRYTYYKWDFFPSASLSYKMSEKSQIYASYTRRINRFPAYFLRPIPIKTSTTSYFQGNPELKPKIINSIELGWSNTFKKNTTLSVEAFYKLTTNDYQFVSSIYSDSISTLHQPNNIGTSQLLGLELNLGLKPIKWWSIDLNGKTYYSVLKGEFRGNNFNKKRFEWAARINNYFTITKSTKLQFTGVFMSKRQTALGIQSSRFSFNVGVKQTFLKRALALSFDIRNVFYTINSESETSYDNYYEFSKQNVLWPFLNLGLSYKINNFRQARRKTESGRGEF